MKEHINKVSDYLDREIEQRLVLKFGLSRRLRLKYIRKQVDSGNYRISEHIIAHAIVTKAMRKIR